MTALPNATNPLAPARATPSQRVAAAVLSAACLALLMVAASLHPDPRGVETHTQLGLWPCGWYKATGYPCPTCGMTTAFAAAAHGRLGLSFKTQPFGAALAVSTATLFWAGLHVAIFGSRLASLGDKLLRTRWVTLAAMFLLLAWAYKAATMRGWPTH